MEWNLSEKVTAFCRDHSLDVKLSSEMPAGYETAFGTYDVTVNTLFLNEKLLERAPQWEVLYYLYHELRLPYEFGANNFAYQKVQKVLGSSPELENLYRSWMPDTPWQYEKLEALFRRIDRRLNGED